jgi:hypothetical protein
MKVVAVGPDMRRACEAAGIECEMVSGDVTAEGFSAIRAADVVVVDARARYAIGIAHGLGKQTVIVEDSRKLDLQSASNPFFGRQLRLGAVDPAVQAFLDEHHITTADQLDLDALAAAVNRNALRGFLRELMRTRSYDEKALQDFMIRRGIFL